MREGSQPCSFSRLSSRRFAALAFGGRAATEKIPVRRHACSPLPAGVDARHSRDDRGVNRVWTQADLRQHRDVTSPAMEVGTIPGSDGLEAIRDAFNGWHLGISGLGQTRDTGVTALWTLQLFIPMLDHGPVPLRASS